MPEPTPEITRRQLLGGLVTVGAAGTAAGAGTMAYFTDSEASTGNTVQAGTLTLGLGSDSSFSFTTSLAPEETTTDSVTLVNTGSVSGSLDVDVSYAESDGSNNDEDVTADQLAQQLEVSTLTYGGSDLSGQLSGSPPTLADLASNDQSSGESTPNDLVDLPDPGSGTDFTLGLTLANVGDTYQSDGVSITVDFTLNQTDAQ